jgi:hypothetical protein
MTRYAKGRRHHRQQRRERVDLADRAAQPAMFVVFVPACFAIAENDVCYMRRRGITSLRILPSNRKRLFQQPEGFRSVTPPDFNNHG